MNGRDTEWVWPDVTGTMVTFLQSMLDDAGLSVPVRTRIPSPRPAQLVRVKRAGGTRDDMFDRAVMQVEVSAADEESTADLAATVRDMVRRLPWQSASGVTAVAEVTGPTLLSDPTDAAPTYLMAFRVFTRPTPAAVPAP